MLTSSTVLAQTNVRSHLVKEAYDFGNDVVWIFWKDEHDFVSPFDRRADIIGAAITNRGTTLGSPEVLSDGGSLEYGFHNFKVGPDGVVRAHFNTFYSDNTPSTIYYTQRSSVTTGLTASTAEMPEQFVLQQNYPNPFNPSTVISFQLPVNSHVTLKAFDVTDRQVATLVDGDLAPGNHSVIFSTNGCASGVYFFRMQAGESVRQKKMVIIR
ncbi:T9SS C-terminal target domain-containing protein [candidate division KSB1 bacterium]|nr:MAG: T9SS C-terminal target domain-containing protein [candidate division KSB1 bacterium]MBC6950939.1 T9SS C-terminal target domain-containing protein [candidate division KSB1 bacterium]MCE7944150.1 T9SS C-terminal target domain-containing protein [Chlorobi bacterium CHB1]MDL1878937.1 T9SS type A sorting domain-containing protein [Cytophagia bacterium CHB2]